MQPYHLALECLAAPNARLCDNKHRPALAWILIALAKPYLDAVEWLINASTTYISVIPRDIRRYILEPLLWIENKLCGIPHRITHRYGVVDGLHITKNKVRQYYAMGLLHRIDGPSEIGETCASYSREGRHRREFGPGFVTRTSVRYSSEYYIGVSLTGTSSFMCFGQHITLYDHGSLIVSDTRLTPVIKDSTMHISTTNGLVSITHPAFGAVMEVLMNHIQSCDIRAECAREWALAQAKP